MNPAVRYCSPVHGLTSGDPSRRGGPHQFLKGWSFTYARAHPCFRCAIAACYRDSQNLLAQTIADEITDLPRDAKIFAREHNNL